MQFSSFNQVEVSFYGPHNRNVIVDYSTVQDITPANGADHYACSFRYEADIKEYVSANMSVKGHNLPHFCDHVIFDVDVKEDLDQARQFTIDLVNQLLSLGIEEDLISVYFSGSKGFHVQTPSSLFGIKPSNDLYQSVKMLCNLIAGDVMIDTAIYDRNRLFRLPNTINSKSGLYKVAISHDKLRGTIEDICEFAKTLHQGTVVECDQQPLPQLQEMWEQILADKANKVTTKLSKAGKAVAVCGSQAIAAVPKFSKVCIARLLNEGILEGNRHNAALRLALHFINEGYPDDAIQVVLEVWSGKCSPPTDEEDFDQMIRNCRSGGYSYGCTDGLLAQYCNSDCYLYRKVAFTGDELKYLHFTDIELAELASRVFGGKILYWDAAEKWLVWDGRRWILDTPGGLFPFIKSMHRKLSISANECEDSDLKSRLRKELIKFESHHRRATIIKAMTVLPELIVTSDQLDADPMLLNCLNGILDLRTGKLLSHDPSYMITRIVNLDFNAEAVCPLFERFVSRIFMENCKLISYVQRFFGYCLTGKTDEQVMLFCYGTGSNGKTTLLKIFLMLLSDFAASAQAELLMAKDARGGASSDIARLKGARLVAVNEVQEDARLDEARVKTLTGGDRITARHLFREFFEFDPQFKLVLVGNHKPTIKGQDHGIWRRIHLLLFNATIPDNERDPELLDKLKLELPGILAWAVRGCSDWHQNGLMPPNEVTDAGNAYRKSEDHFGQWFDDCCDPKDNAIAMHDLMHASFVEHSGMSYVTKNKMSKWLIERGYEHSRKDTGKYWIGIKLNVTRPLCSEEG